MDISNIKVLVLPPETRRIKVDTIKVLPITKYPSVSVIIPYRIGEKFNPIWICSNDEAIIVLGGWTIGHARIAGAKVAKYNWLVFMDADAIYPLDYILKIKDYIKRVKKTVLATIRTGGFDNIFFDVHEHGLIVHRDEFFKRVLHYPQGVRQAGRRTDIADYFRDAVKIPVKYYHGFTKGEKRLIVAGVGFSAMVVEFYLLSRIKAKG